MKENGIIQDSMSPWASRIVIVPKGEGVRICNDYRPLNAMTTKDVYPLPSIQEIQDILAKARVFCIIDCTSGYHQFEIAEKDRAKTAFRFKGGFYEYVRVPFGLTNAPAFFQRQMDLILKDIAYEFVVPYLDDIIIFSENEETHQGHIEQTLERLQQHNLIINPDKCKFFKKEVLILGTLISHGTAKPDPEKLLGIQRYKQPETILQMRSFLGLINFCRECVPDLAAKIRPLTEVLKGEIKKSKNKVDWTEKRIQCFQETKKLFQETLQRRLPCKNRKFVLICDASAGAILAQRNMENELTVVSCFSRVVDKTQCNYGIIQTKKF
jgi:hypothetical protein